MKTMKLLFGIISLTSILFLSGCDEFDEFDSRPPAEPSNIRTITGDNRVDIIWDENYERDVAGYNVYYSYSYDGKYELIGSTEDNYFIDYDAKNGETYYYAVTAYDYNGNESDLSYDIIYDTPRPEGFNQAIFDFNVSTSNSGYDFSNYLVVPYNGEDADFFFEIYNGTPYLDVWDDSDIQDMGATNDIWDVDAAPTSGWIPKDNEEDNFKYVEAIAGHTYVVWTWDNHFAKVRISNITNERIVFDWAYQLVEGNIELKRGASKVDRDNMPDKLIRTR
jgi:hypothetical protein